MVKNMLIAALAAGYALQCPWFAVCDVATKAVIWLVLSICLLFFCLFCEGKHEKRLKKRKRERELQERISRLISMGERGYADGRERA